MEGTYKQTFDEVVSKVRNMKQLRLLGPFVPSGVAPELQELVDLACRKALEDSLATILLDEGLHLTLLQLGLGDLGCLPIFAQQLQGIPMTSKVLSGLETIAIARLVEEDDVESVQQPRAPDTTRNLEDFLSLAPKLQWLEYRGGLYDPLMSKFKDMDKLPRSLLPRSNLTRIAFSHLNMSEASLCEYLLKSKTSLKSLGLRYIDLTPGAWRSVFGILRSQSLLKFLTIESLIQTDKKLGLARMKEQRPLLIDSETAQACEDDWNSVVGELADTYERQDDTYKAKAAELHDFLDGDWVLVFRNIHGRFGPTFDADEGCDISACISSIEHNWEMHPD